MHNAECIIHNKKPTTGSISYRVSRITHRFSLCIMHYALCIALTGCGSYSFTGTSLSPEVKSISIQTFPNNSGGGPASLSQTFSEKLRDYFQRNTNLNLVTRSGDVQFEGYISGWELTPLPPTANDVASQNRLTMRVKAIYTNTKDESQNFEQDFSFFADFPSNANPATFEPQLIETISNQIINDMFNKSVANW